MRTTVPSLLAILFLSAACGSSATTDPGNVDKNPTDEDDAGGTTPVTSNSCSGDLSSTACEVCINTSCCDVLTACMDSTACAGLVACANPCGSDESCLQRCSDEYPTAYTSYNALASCHVASCSSACSTTPTPTTPTSGSCAAAAGDTSCTTCVKSMCCSSISACEADPSCVAYENCTASCTTAACTSACGSSADYVAYLECGLTNCESECQ